MVRVHQDIEIVPTYAASIASLILNQQFLSPGFPASRQHRLAELFYAVPQTKLFRGSLPPSIAAQMSECLLKKVLKVSFPSGHILPRLHSFYFLLIRKTFSSRRLLNSELPHLPLNRRESVSSPQQWKVHCIFSSSFNIHHPYTLNFNGCIQFVI